LNATVGAENEGLQQIMERQGLGKISENGGLFTEFCVSQELVTGGTVFPTKKVSLGYLGSFRPCDMKTNIT
jgi:hypothetical protein